MKTFLSTALLALCAAQGAFPESDAFDITSFVAPRGWSRTEANGMLLMQQQRRTLAGRVEFCQIYLFSSRPGNANPAGNFQAEWESRIVRGLGIAARPVPQTERTPDGWTTVTGFADFANKGVPMRAILVTATGFGKVATVLVNVSPNSYQSELQSFFRDLHFNNGAPPSAPLSSAPPAEIPPRSDAPLRQTPPAPGSLANYVYTPPAMWTRQGASDRITLTSPTYGNGERCQITLLPMRPANRPVADEAINAFREIFRADPLSPFPAQPAKLFKGTSPQGWEYFLIRKLVGGQEGDGKGFGTILLEAKVGDQVATIFGTSKDFIVSNCFGELVADKWPEFFYSLQFKNSPPAPTAAAIQRQLAGVWIMATGSVGLRYAFAANGRYAGAAARQYTSRISATELLQTTDAYFGDGSYSFDGNTLVMAGDDRQRTAQLFRLHQESRDNGRTWSDGMCLLDPGASGEVCYRKE